MHMICTRVVIAPRSPTATIRARATQHIILDNRAPLLTRTRTHARTRVASTAPGPPLAITRVLVLRSALARAARQIDGSFQLLPTRARTRTHARARCTDSATLLPTRARTRTHARARCSDSAAAAAAAAAVVAVVVAAAAVVAVVVAVAVVVVVVVVVVAIGAQVAAGSDLNLVVGLKVSAACSCAGDA